MTQSNIPEGATHTHNYSTNLFYRVTDIVEYYDPGIGKYKACSNNRDVKLWMESLIPITPPSVRPYNAFTAELDRVIQLRGLELLNAMQRKIEASEGIPIEWLNELMDFYGVSE